MLQYRSHTFRFAALALLAIALVLWLNFAFIEHQYDFSSNHHHAHNCQLFANGLHALSPALPVVANPFFNPLRTPILAYQFSEVTTFAYLARSPPVS